jgi:hypothetical protein
MLEDLLVINMAFAGDGEGRETFPVKDISISTRSDEGVEHLVNNLGGQSREVSNGDRRVHGVLLDTAS